MCFHRPTLAWTHMQCTGMYTTTYHVWGKPKSIQTLRCMKSKEETLTAQEGLLDRSFSDVCLTYYSSVCAWLVEYPYRKYPNNRHRNNMQILVNFIRLPRMTEHKCAWSVGVTDQHAWIQSSMNTLSGAWHIWLHGFEPANFFFSLFSSCTSSIQPISFFSPLFFPTSHICTTQPGFESSLENTYS